MCKVQRYIRVLVEVVYAGTGTGVGNGGAILWFHAKIAPLSGLEQLGSAWRRSTTDSEANDKCWIDDVRMYCYGRMTFPETEG